MLSMQTPERNQPRFRPQSTPSHFLIKSDMGFKTAPAAAGSISKIPVEDLDMVRRKLDFSARQVRTLLYPGSPATDNPVKYSESPPPDVSSYYDSIIMTSLLDHLQIGVPRFYFALHWSGNIDVKGDERYAVWEVVVVVDGSLVDLTRFHVMEYQNLYRPKIPIRVTKGQYEWVSSVHKERAQQPTPGASIGVDGDLRNSVSLGGYVVGDRTKKIYAMTVGHMWFDEPQSLNSPPPTLRMNRLVQPSHQDFDGQLKVLRKDRDALLAAGDSSNAAQIDDMINNWWKYRLRNGFAEPEFAIWNTASSNPDEIPSIQDMSLSLVYNTRLGTNALLPVPRRGICATSI